jgi:hypothetical protein
LLQDLEGIRQLHRLPRTLLQQHHLKDLVLAAVEAAEGGGDGIADGRCPTKLEIGAKERLADVVAHPGALSGLAEVAPNDLSRRIEEVLLQGQLRPGRYRHCRSAGAARLRHPQQEEQSQAHQAPQPRPPA